MFLSKNTGARTHLDMDDLWKLNNFLKRHQVVLILESENRLIRYYYRAKDSIVHCYTYSSNVGDRFYQFGVKLSILQLMDQFNQKYEGYQVRFKIIPLDSDVYLSEPTSEELSREQFNDIVKQLKESSNV